MGKRFQDQVVVIIGATGGLGAAFAQAFANEGARLLLVGRNAERLSQVAVQFSADTHVHPIDMTDSASLDALVDFTQTTFGRADVIVNATGVDVRKAFDQHSLADIRNTLDLNLIGSILVTRAFMPMMQRQARGTIVNIGGFADGRLAMPYFTVDVASRAGLATFTEALNREVQGSGVNVLFFSPSPADTATEREFHPLWRKMDLAVAPADQVAKELLNAVAQRKQVHVMGGVATIIFAKLNAAFPRLADAVMMNHYSEILRQFFAPMQAESSATEKPKSWGRWLGIGLVALSFVLYSGLALVPFVPAALEQKIAISTALVVSGEASFWIGGAILGKEIVARYRKWLNPCNWGWLNSKGTANLNKEN